MTEVERDGLDNLELLVEHDCYLKPLYSSRCHSYCHSYENSNFVRKESLDRFACFVDMEAVEAESAVAAHDCNVAYDYHQLRNHFES